MAIELRHRKAVHPAAPARNEGGYATSADLFLALLFPLAWAAPRLVPAALFELLVTCLAAEIMEVFVLLVVSKRLLPETPEQFRADWNLARWAILAVIGYQVLAGKLGWPVLLFLAPLLLTAGLPLRLAPHRDWRERLNLDIWLLLGIAVGAALLAWIFAGFSTLSGLRIPADGLVHDLVTRHQVKPQEVLALGSFYFFPKALLNGYRFLQDKKGAP